MLTQDEDGCNRSALSVKAVIMRTVQRTDAFMAAGCRVCWGLLKQDFMQSAEHISR